MPADAGIAPQRHARVDRERAARDAAPDLSSLVPQAASAATAAIAARSAIASRAHPIAPFDPVALLTPELGVNGTSLPCCRRLNTNDARLVSPLEFIE